ncbi:hypothetical protein [Candidatus Nanohalococcus occultus]|uniref:hypothetical protein n=1 Tax=Candidatus Nanohalococcus occultus TaxID=2978047 RepID=UPI0039DF6409
MSILAMNSSAINSLQILGALASSLAAIVAFAGVYLTLILHGPSKIRVKQFEFDRSSKLIEAKFSRGFAMIDEKVKVEFKYSYKDGNTKRVKRRQKTVYPEFRSWFPFQRQTEDFEVKDDVAVKSTSVRVWAGDDRVDYESKDV